MHPSRSLSLAKLVSLTALGCLVGVADSACSFATNTTAVQCTSEAECLSLGPAFAGTTCDKATRTCVKVPLEEGLCSKNQECIDRAGGVDAICRKRDRKCVTLKTPECPTLFAKPGQLLDDNTIVIGALTPAAHTELGDNMESAMGLAQAEIAKQVRGLPSPEGSSDVRPLVILSCREFNQGGAEDLLRAANHLAKTVQVPLVIGPVDPANAQLTTQNVMIPNRILTILPFGFTTSLKDFPNPIAPTPIIWSLFATDQDSTTATQELISKQLVQKLQGEGVAGPIRVALMAEDNYFGVGGASLMEQKLNFNGKTAAQNLADGNYLRVNIGNLIDPVGNPAPEAKVAQAIQAVIDFKPHIVLHSYAPAAIGPTFINLVMSWPAALPLAYHVDMLSTFGAFAPILDIVSQIPPYRSRVFSVTAHLPPETEARIPAFLINFRSEFPQFRTSTTAEGTLVHDWYDAGYLAAYAITANRNKPLTGENLAQTLAQFSPPSQKVRTGTEDLSKALGLLNSGQGIDVDGVSGNMDLDPRTGFPAYNVEFTCPDAPDPATGRVLRFKKSGFYAEGGAGKGALACP